MRARQRRSHGPTRTLLLLVGAFLVVFVIIGLLQWTSGPPHSSSSSSQPPVSNVIVIPDADVDSPLSNSLMSDKPAIKTESPQQQMVEDEEVSPQHKAIMKNQHFLPEYPTTVFNETLLDSMQNKSDFWKSHGPSFTCPSSLLIRVGGKGERAGKWTCGLTTLGMRNEQGCKRCSLYSFGVSKDSSFEAEVLLNTPCNVYTYDPKATTMGFPLNNSANNPRVEFQQGSLGGSEWGELFKKSETLESLMAKHGDTFIDILRLNMDGEELKTLEQIMQEFGELPVGQILVELHLMENNNRWWGSSENQGKASLINLIKRLEERGMRLFSIEINNSTSNSAEYSFINLNYLSLFVDKTF